MVSAFFTPSARAQSVLRPSTSLLPATSPAPLAGKFRVTINGFKANSATRDHILDIDGVGDEVFVSANVIVMDSSAGLATPLATIESRVYGENRRDLITRNPVWAGRTSAGSGTPLGGLRDGNQFPHSEPWKRWSQPTSESLPIEVWCGTLTEGSNAVIMIPSIWEWDGVASTFEQWLAWVDQVATNLTNNQTFRDLVGKKGMSAVELGKQLVLGAAVSLDSIGLIGGERDRPIGVVKSKTRPKTFDYTPSHKFVLNYASADFSTRDAGGGSVGGAAPGTYALQYADDPFYKGRYTLWVQIERIDGGKCSHQNEPGSGGKIDPNKPKP